MKNIYDIYLNSEYVDGHIHLFDHNGVISKDLIDTNRRCVCFADIVFKHLKSYSNKMISYYNDFIDNYYDPNKHILLSTGIDANEIIDIYSKWPDKIKGFGELKCYNDSIQGKLPYGNLKWIEPIMEFNKNLKLPVYIHFELDDIDRRHELEEFLHKYNDIPIVLCHCGMIKENDETTDNEIFFFVKHLMSTCNNLYIDLSTLHTREYFINNIGKLLQLNLDRVITGTDLNPIVNNPEKNYLIKDPIKFKNTCYKQIDILNKYIDKDNVDKLFCQIK